MVSNGQPIASPAKGRHEDFQSSAIGTDFPLLPSNLIIALFKWGKMELKISNLSIERDCLPPIQGELNSTGKPVLQKLYMDLELKGFGVLVGKSIDLDI